MKKFFEVLREHAMKIINYEKNKIIPLTKELQESQEKTKICYICKKRFEHKYTNDKNYRNICNYNICNLKYCFSKWIEL